MISYSKGFIICGNSMILYILYMFVKLITCVTIRSVLAIPACNINPKRI